MTPGARPLLAALLAATLAATLGWPTGAPASARSGGPLPAEGLLVFSDPVVSDGSLADGTIHVDVVVVGDAGATRAPREGLTVELRFPAGNQASQLATTDAAGGAAFDYEVSEDLCGSGAQPVIEVRDVSGTVLGEDAGFPYDQCWAGADPWFLQLDGASGRRYDWLEARTEPRFAGAAVVLQLIDPKSGELLRLRRGVISDYGHAVFKVRDRNGHRRMFYAAEAHPGPSLQDSTIIR